MFLFYDSSFLGPCLDPFWVRVRVHLGVHVWIHFGLGLGSILGPCLDPFWVRVRVHVWIHFGLGLRSIWVHFGDVCV